MRLIPLTKGKYAHVDDEDFDYLNQFSWHIARNYAVRTCRLNGKKTISMHREILGNPNSDIDHIDGNELNNQKANLRLATPTQNGGNRKKESGCSSQYKGVYWEKKKNKWKAQIKIQGKTKSIGLFASEIEAARAYDLFAEEVFGEFAKTNF